MIKVFLLLIIANFAIVFCTEEEDVVWGGYRSTSGANADASYSFAAWLQLSFRPSTPFSSLTNSYCTASILSDLWLLTSADCLNKAGSRLESIVAVVGVQNLTQKAKGQSLSARQWFQHENYNPTTGANNIAVIKLSRPINATRGNVSYVTIPNCGRYNENSTMFDGCFSGLALGWGLTEQQKYSQQLLQTSQSHFRFSDCRNVEPFSNSKFCVGIKFPKEEGRTCLGDGGGPFGCDGTAGRWQQIAIINAPSNSCSNDTSLPPQIYTRLCVYKPWIQQYIKGCDDAVVPSVVNGRITAGDSVYKGATVPVICNSGFKIRGASQIVCDGAEWSIPGTCDQIGSTLFQMSPLNSRIFENWPSANNFGLPTINNFNIRPAPQVQGPSSSNFLAGSFPQLNVGTGVNRNANAPSANSNDFQPLFRNVMSSFLPNNFFRI